jgi:SHS family lactate transporter-like MFS transporter
MPVECRGLFSGFIQLGYPVGYLIVAALNTNANVGAPMGWRYLFFAGAAFSAFSAITRAVLPESTYFKLKKEQEREARAADGLRSDAAKESVMFLKDFGRTMKQCWARCILTKRRY